MTNIDENISNYFTYPERAVEALRAVVGRPLVGSLPGHLALTVAQARHLGFVETGFIRLDGPGYNYPAEYYRLTPAGRATLRIVLADRVERLQARGGEHGES